MAKTSATRIMLEGNIDVLRDMYLNRGKTGREIASFFGVHRGTIYAFLRSNGICLTEIHLQNRPRTRMTYIRTDKHRRDCSMYARKFFVDSQTLKHDYVEGKNKASALANKYGVSTSTIWNWLRAYKISLSDDDRLERTIESIKSRYDGVRSRSRGYIYIKKSDHPHASSDGYVPEHRLVAERFIGYVIPKESEVHHLNFNKHDNSIENLVLFWSGSDHTVFHKYLERLGAYFSGVMSSPPSPLIYEKPILFSGRWLASIDLAGEKTKYMASAA